MRDNDLRNEDLGSSIVDINVDTQARCFSVPLKHLDDYSYNEIVDFLNPGDGWKLHNYNVNYEKRFIFIIFLKTY
jgi:hypothetical protein